MASHVDSGKVVEQLDRGHRSFQGSRRQHLSKQINLASADIDSKKRNLNIFAVTAVMAGLLVSLFAMLTIARILRALNELQRTLGNIIEEENFTLRLHPGGKATSSATSAIPSTNCSIHRLTDPRQGATGLHRRADRHHESPQLAKSTAREMSRADRYGTECAYLIDIDHFKRVNERARPRRRRRGAQGFAEVLCRNLRTSDLLARWGGEEFVVLAPETRPEAALQFAEKLRERVAAEQFPGSDPSPAASAWPTPGREKVSTPGSAGRRRPL